MGGSGVERLISASSAEVSRRMRLQSRRDTRPEMAVRRLLHGSGLRYRLQWKVPGMSRRTIDVAFPGRRVAVFVDGCFWHGCPDHATSPKANSEWWRAKLDRNGERDRETTAHLERDGWVVLRFWEHEDPVHVAARIEAVVRAAR
ncbi:very short patch repair endonuclease [Streptomyces sp. NPDC002812]|uniref:very short patch repair endonuclease n=1 Tax=Streptomyces sp. NPDC002812 TaxID=3154434 RepID=UPI00331D288F